MIDIFSIIRQYYTHGTPLYTILVKHSTQVARLASQFCVRLQSSGTAVDAQFVQEAAMLHDIGIFRTNAPGICCTGAEPYIRHGIIGRQLLDEQGLPRHALVCERHTGTGLTAHEIIEQGLPLPHRDMLPLSIEEQVVCYADKFYSKSHVDAPAKPIDAVRRSLSKFGPGTLQRLDGLIAKFGLPDYDAIDQEC